MLSYSDAMMLIGGKPVASLTCTLDGTAQYDTQDGAANMTIDAYGQEFQVATSGNLCKICVYVDGNGGTFTLRLDDDTDMSSEYMEELGTSSAISSAQWYCFNSTDEDALATSTNYYIAILEASDNVKWYRDSGAGYTYDAKAAVSGWTLGGNLNTLDWNFRIYTWQ